MNEDIERIKSMEIAGFSTGAIVTGLGLLLWSPIVNDWNVIGFLMTMVGLFAFGGFAKNKWY